MHIICVKCPVGCDMVINEAPELQVQGNQCPAGVKFAKEELTNPTRNIATSVKIAGGDMPMLSVKTKSPIPKQKIFEVVDAVKKVKVQAPIAVGDVILPNAANTGVDMVATRNVYPTPS